MIETGVIRLRERDDELACALVAGIYVDTRLLQPLRIHQRYQLEEKVGLRLEQVGGLPLDGRLEFLSRGARNAVPRLRLAPVHYTKFRKTNERLDSFRTAYCS